MRWVLTLLAMSACALAVVFALFVRQGAESERTTLPRSPMPGRLLAGFQDDASFRWADDRAEMIERARRTGISVIRTTVVWSEVAPERPREPRDSFDPAYRLDDVDDLVRSAQQRGIELLITIWGTPAWANGGAPPNRPPLDPGELESFAEAIGDRYSGRHTGYPAVRLFSAWNEPNLEQFLAPQFDAAGRSVGPALYAPLARAVYDGIKRANEEALVAIGETSPRGHDRPSRGEVQDSHSPARFARLLSEVRPTIRFDAWAQHPYPPRAEVAPADPVRWPRVGLANLDRLGAALDDWFRRDGTPLWITEYGHETRPAEPLGIGPSLQARYAADALALAAESPRVRMFLWFIFRDRAETPWQSGLLAQDGSPKPALDRFAEVAAGIDGRNPVLPDDADFARLPALELAFHTPAGTPLEVTVAGEEVATALQRDGWIDVPIDGASGDVLAVRARDPFGHTVSRTVRLGDRDTFELD
jgi:polysaccharide biosynthesis protein PslG